jgi:hypothetical protein
MVRRLTPLEAEVLWALFAVDHRESFSQVVLAIVPQKKKWLSALPGSKEDRLMARLYKKGYAVRAQDVDWLQVNRGPHNKRDAKQQNSYRISEDGRLRLLNPSALLVASVMEE